MRMHAVGLKILKNKLSEYVRLAASGESVLISDRGKVVAELVPPRATRADRVTDAMLADAIRKGFITPAALPPARPLAAPKVARLDEILAELSDDRAER